MMMINNDDVMVIDDDQWWWLSMMFLHDGITSKALVNISTLFPIRWWSELGMAMSNIHGVKMS